ncbi:MAG: hypothetical protein QG623_80 [Patescibacteria group bacterium]|nr:hypothetical protein [Patescibacteria group bacterium]
MSKDKVKTEAEDLKPLRLSEVDLRKLEIPLGNRTKTYRFFEILPGLMSYLVVATPLIIGIWRADIAGFLILLFMLVWFFRTASMAFKALSTLAMTHEIRGTDWRNLLKDDYKNAKENLNALEMRRKLSRLDKFRMKCLIKFEISTDRALDPEDLVHVVMVPMVSEPYEVVRGAVLAAVEQNYDVRNKVILQLCPEERANHANAATVAKLKEEFAGHFLRFIVSEHPFGLEGELIGKGGNINWAAKDLIKELDSMKVDHEKVMITGMDADCIMDKQYLAHLSYVYLINLNRDNASYQPLAIYTNNIWDAPAPMRVLAVGNSFYTLLQASRPHLQRNFSSHSQSLASLFVTNFWSSKTIVEDGHQYWRSYMAFKGRYRVESMFVPNYQDAVLNESYRKTLMAQFKQLQRWAYGVSDIPYIFTRGIYSKDKIDGVPFWPTMSRFLRHLENDISWAAAPILLAVGAWLPIIFARDSDASIVAHQLPEVARWVQTLASVGVLSSVYVAFRILPKRPERYKKSRSIFMWVQWILIPVTGLIYGSTTGFNAQTRLMLGKRLEKFDVTEKHRKH